MVNLLSAIGEGWWRQIPRQIPLRPRTGKLARVFEVQNVRAHGLQAGARSCERIESPGPVGDVPAYTEGDCLVV
jgi:hypothetical protein